MKRILSALLAAFLLASCAPAPGGGAKEPDSSSLPESTISAAPGLLAQEDGKLNPGCRSELDYPQRVNLDISYIMNWTIWMDYYIFLKTVKEVILCRGAR